MMKNKADAETLLATQIDEQTMNDLLGLTNMEVNLAAMKYGADAQDVATLRQILGTSGAVMIGAGTNTGGLGTALGNLFATPKQ